MTTNTTFTKINPVTKMNKGTSRDQWGCLNFHSYKTQDGKLRARLFCIVGGKARLEIRLYTKPTNRWGTRLTWDEAELLGSSYLDVSDFETGIKAVDIIPEVNALIEIYNDECERNLGRMVQVKSWSGEAWAPEPLTVGGVSVSFDQDSVMSMNFSLCNKNGWHSRYASNEMIRDYPLDEASKYFNEKLNDIRKEVEKDLAFLDMVKASVDRGDKVSIDNPYEHVGYMGSTANGLIDAANSLISINEALNAM